MIGLVEQFAAQIKLVVARNNVIVEGTSDVAFLTHASDLHAREHGRAVFDASFAVVAAGAGDEGGVDGVNRRLHSMRQLSDADRDASGALYHRFIGLFDNDAAGRSAFAVSNSFDRRVEPYVDIFLLHPVMPPPSNGIDDARMLVARLNRPFERLDWEIEDLCSERILSAFEHAHPGSVVGRVTKGGRVHRELTRAAKPQLREFFVANATINDAVELLVLLRQLRSYMGLDYDFIKA